MKSIQIHTQLVDDKFKSIELNPEMATDQVLPELVKFMQVKNADKGSIDYKYLIAKQITDLSETSLESLGVESGDYLILVSMATAAVKLRLVPEKRFDHHAGWLLEHQEALIGRDDDETNLHPDVDLTSLARDPLTISRRLAYLREVDGVWTIQLHRDGHSGVFVNKKKLESGKSIQLQDMSVLSFGNNPTNPDFQLQIRLVTD